MSAPDEATYRLETPDNVELHFDLAGPGSRFCALCIDGAIIAAVLFGLAVILLIVGVALPGALSNVKFLEADGKVVMSWGVAVLFLVFALATSGYHALFELFMRGQTPGKRALGIRAISDDGTAMSPSQALLRNVLRAVDLLPGCYAVGGLFALLGPSYRRLGDLAAGTIVVKEAAPTYVARTDARNAASRTAVAPPANAELSADEARLVENFLSRRDELLPAARTSLANRIAEPLFAKYGGAWTDAESYLERLLGNRHRDR